MHVLLVTFILITMLAIAKANLSQKSIDLQRTRAKVCDDSYTQIRIHNKCYVHTPWIMTIIVLIHYIIMTNYM